MPEQPVLAQPARHLLGRHRQWRLHRRGFQGQIQVGLLELREVYAWLRHARASPPVEGTGRPSVQQHGKPQGCVKEFGGRRHERCNVYRYNIKSDLVELDLASYSCSYLP